MCRISQFAMSGILVVILLGFLSSAAGLAADDFKFDRGQAKAKESTAKDSSLKETTSKETVSKETVSKDTKAKDAKAKEAKTKEAKIKAAKEAKAKEVLAKEVSLGISPKQIEFPAPSYGISEALLKLHNDFRARKGLPPFKLHPKLTAAAQRYAEYTFHRGRFGHYVDGTSPPERISAEGLKHGSWAENMALGQQSPSAAVSAWLSSSGHRKNILSDHTHVGFGNMGGVWVTVFANPIEREDKVEPEAKGQEFAKK